MRTIDMQINLPDSIDVTSQAHAAGFANADEYVVSLIQREQERRAIQAGLDAARDGRTRAFNEFDAQFRKQQGIP
jgi:hypothetical protein